MNNLKTHKQSSIEVCTNSHTLITVSSHSNNYWFLLFSVTKPLKLSTATSPTWV